MKTSRKAVMTMQRVKEMRAVTMMIKKERMIMRAILSQSHSQVYKYYIQIMYSRKMYIIQYHSHGFKPYTC